MNVEKQEITFGELVPPMWNSVPHYAFFVGFVRNDKISIVDGGRSGEKSPDYLYDVTFVYKD